jgi:hypothetical protein
MDETLELSCNVDLGATQESIALLLVPPFLRRPPIGHLLGVWGECIHLWLV